MAPPTHALDKLLSRGAVLYYLETRLDDPDRSQRWKYAVVVNHRLPGDPILFFLATSNPAFYADGEYDANILRVPVGSYNFLSKESIFDMKVVGKKPAKAFQALHDDGKCRRVGELSEEHLREIDDKVWLSDLIPLRDIEAITGKKPKILP